MAILACTGYDTHALLIALAWDVQAVTPAMLLTGRTAGDRISDPKILPFCSRNLLSPELSPD